MKPWPALLDHTRSAHVRFLAGLHDTERAQLEQLRSILKANAECAFVRRYGFSGIGDADSFRERVPVHRYEGLAPEIETMLEGGQHRLVS